MIKDDGVQERIGRLVDKYDLSVEFDGNYRMSIVGNRDDKELGMAQIIPRALLYDKDADEVLGKIKIAMQDKMKYMMFNQSDRRW